MKPLTLTVALAFAFAGTASAHTFHFHPSLAKRSLSARAAGQRQVIRHDRAVIAETCARPAPKVHLLRFTIEVPPDWQAVLACRFHRAQIGWTRRELGQTLALIRAQARHPSIVGSGNWTSAQATWYGPGFYGNGHKCPGSGVLTESSWWVAHMTLPCGTTVTLCDGRRCATAKVLDRGAFAYGNFDVTPAVARALGGLHTHSVRWRRG